MRAPARSGALSLLRPDVVAALGLLDLARRARREAERLRDIVVPAIDVRAGTGSASRPRMRSGRAAAPGFASGSLTKRLVVLLAIAFWNSSSTPSCSASAVANWSAFSTRTQPWLRCRSGSAEQRLGRRVVEVDRLVVLHVELDQAERILRPRLLDVLAVLHDEIVVARATPGPCSRAPSRRCPWAPSRSGWRPAGRSAPGAAASACRARR